MITIYLYTHLFTKLKSDEVQNKNNEVYTRKKNS